MFVINDSNYTQVLGEMSRNGLMTGCVPREVPVGAYSSSKPFTVDIPLIPRENWPDMIAEREAKRAQLSNLRNWPSLDQNGQGFCWAYSTTAAVMLSRTVANFPYVRLSPHSVACKIYNFEDRGAWGAKSMQFISENGVAPESHWPQQSMSRQYDNPTTWQAAKDYRITEGWLDIDVSHPADAELNFDQIMTLLLTYNPVVLDYDWWGHSVCGMDPVDVTKSGSLSNINRWGIRILNSWSDNWKDKGTAVLQGNKAMPMGACAPSVVIGS